MSNSLHPALSALAHQLRIIYIDERGPQAADVWSPATAATLQRYGRRFAAELYMASQQLRDQLEGMEGAEPEVLSELQRTLWSVCIWELCLMVFVGRPAVITEALIPWWQLHLCDRKVADELPSLESLERPEAKDTFWRTLRSLVARGMRAEALRLLKQHSVLRAGDRDVGGPEEQVLWPLLDRLETLLEFMPRLFEPELVQPHRDEAGLGVLEQQALRTFQHNHATWRADVSALVRDAELDAPSVPAAAEIATSGRLLLGDEAVLREHTEQWHGLLIGRLLYQSPTVMRWQLPSLLAELEGQLPSLLDEARRDPFQAIVLAILADDPWATLKSVRDAFGDGWLASHLWDLLSRAGIVGVDQMADTGLDVRSYLMLQYARALGTVPSLWQLAAQYAADLLLTPSAESAARALIGQLVRDQPVPHVVKLRKLLALCEQHGMVDEARELVSRAARARAQSAQDGVARPAAAALDFFVPAADATDRLITIAECALEAAVDAAASGAPLAGSAIAELRAMLRSKGVGGARYYTGPKWLPLYVDLLELVTAMRPTAGGNVADVGMVMDDAAVGGGGTGETAQRIQALLVTLATERNDVVGDILPNPLMRKLLQLVSGLGWAPAVAVDVAVAVGGRPHHTLPGPPLIGSSACARADGPSPALPRAFTAASIHILLREHEKLKSSASRHVAPGGGGASARLDSDLSLALSEGLAGAILDEAALTPRGSCWAAL